mmetsp:Transcript_35037/g.81307  ORF Transcript_35037/g.81307 Transcript_35037/m.81307 type:complete len:391 (+) Transcript_35037:44-1216(+)
MADGGAVSFTISREGVKGKPAKTFTLRPGVDAAVRIGRAPGNDIVVEHRGASQYHAELRLVADASGSFRLHVRDLSLNGTGLKKVEGKQAECLAKNNNEPVPDGAVLLVPMMLKAALTQNDRAWLKVNFQDTPPALAEQGTTPARTAAEAREESGIDNQTAVRPLSQRAPSPALAPRAASPPPAQAPSHEGNGSASEQDEDKDAEKSRMQFVELLLKTREVSARTTYDEARKLLSTSAAWDAVDEQTRRECFEIFVEHLGNHNSKKGKKKEKGKGKKEKRRHREDEEAAPQKEAALEVHGLSRAGWWERDDVGGEHQARMGDVLMQAPRGKRRKDPERKGGSASPERAHRKSKREKKGREKSRGRSAGGNCSRSASRQQKKRRRGRSGSA